MIPTRSCLACRRRADKSSLIRLTAASGTVRVDAAATSPGRGAYLCHREACLDAALDRGARRLLRALRVAADEITVDDQALRAAWTESTRTRRTTGGGQHPVAAPEASATAKV